MIMNGDKKGFAAMIVKNIGGKKDEIEKAPQNEYGDEVDSSAGHDAAVQEMFDAIDNKDKNKFKEALKSFIQLCMDEEESETEEGPSEAAEEVSKE